MNLREYQKRVVNWAKTSDGLIIAPAGSGKTWIAASIVNLYPNDRIGWLAPTIETCKQAKVALDLAGVDPARYEIRCPHESVDFTKCELLIVDECFPSWTKIGHKNISEIKAGDMVDSYNHDLKTVEKRRVLEVFKTPAPDTMVTVWTENGPTTCTPGHPFWNGFKYVPAVSLTRDDVVAIIPSHEHGMQRMWVDDRKKRSFFNNSEAGLQSMQNRSQVKEKETRRNSMCLVQNASHLHGENTGLQESGCNQTWSSILLDSVSGFDGFKNEFGNNVGHQQADGRQDFQMDVREDCLGPDQKTHIGIAEKDRPQAKVARRKWERPNIAAKNSFAYVQSTNGVSDTNSKQWDSKCSKLLQSGSGETRSETSNRGGRFVARFTRKESCGQKENRNTQFTRVVRVEVHKQGSDSWISGMLGENFVYNFSVEGNENYFANGILVHNCKHSPANQWKRVVEQCNGRRYGFDATPWCDDPDRNEVLRKLFRNRQIEITRGDIGDSLADATLVMSNATDMGLEMRIDNNIERLFKDRRRYMRISDEELKRMCAWESIVDIGICQNNARNEYARDVAITHGDMQTLILVPRITLGEWYEHGIPGARLVHSKIGKKDRRSYMEEFKSGNLKTMIATSLADEGLDLPNAELLIMVSGGRSPQKTIQRASRVLRKTSDKNNATIYDFTDKFHPIGAFHARKRIKSYKQLGIIDECESN
jgi:superfamily II DNA or RNA helicase